MAAAGSYVAHCPSSNAALGSGIFPMRRHIEAGVGCALGTDVGGGTGFGMLKEGLQAYLMQRLANGSGAALLTAHLLYLVTRAIFSRANRPILSTSKHPPEAPSMP